MPKNNQIWPKIGIFGQFGPGHAGLFGALLVGRLVVVARGLYLATHLFTLCKKIDDDLWLLSTLLESYTGSSSNSGVQHLCQKLNNLFN